MFEFANRCLHRGPTIDPPSLAPGSTFLANLSGSRDVDWLCCWLSALPVACRLFFLEGDCPRRNDRAYVVVGPMPVGLVPVRHAVRYTADFKRVAERALARDYTPSED